MSTITQKRLVGPARMSNTANSTIYTTPSSTTTIIKQITICNTHSGTVSVTLSLVPTGATAGDEHKVLSAISLSAGETITLSTSYVLVTGDTIKGSASTDAVVNIMLNGITEV
jgi:hypothetical protein